MIRTYYCYKLSKPIDELNGRLDKPCWINIPWTDEFVDILGDSRPKPRLKTRAKMAWDSEHLYIGAMLEEPHVWGTITHRDAVIFHDNDFEVFIDPDGDNHQYYELEINALNTVWDLLLIKPYRDGGPAVNGWDIAGLKTAVHTDGTINDPMDRDKGWSVEIALPWAALRECAHAAAPPNHGDRWRINFSRVQWHTEIVAGKYVKTPNLPEDNWVWSPQAAVDMHRPETWGQVIFTHDPASITAPPPPADPDDNLRAALMNLYYAQRDYHHKHAKFASQISQLSIREHLYTGISLTLQAIDQAYVATAIHASDAAKSTWTIREDSRLTRVE